MNLVEVDARGIIERIDELLEAKYRSADLGNLEDPLAETVYILLSRQTREVVYGRIFADLGGGTCAGSMFSRRQKPRSLKSYDRLASSASERDSCTLS